MDTFDSVLVEMWVECLHFLIVLKQEQKPGALDLFMLQSLFDNWITWSDLFASHIAQLCSQQCCTLLFYLLWLHDEVMDTLYNVMYDSIDNNLIAITHLTDTMYQHNSICFFHILKPLVIDTMGWLFVYQYNLTWNGQKAY